eukprot:3232014-Rhodomonas_salina.1
MQHSLVSKDEHARTSCAGGAYLVRRGKSPLVSGKVGVHSEQGRGDGPSLNCRRFQKRPSADNRLTQPKDDEEAADAEKEELQRSHVKRRGHDCLERDSSLDAVDWRTEWWSKDTGRIKDAASKLGGRYCRYCNCIPEM